MEKIQNVIINYIAICLFCFLQNICVLILGNSTNIASKLLTNMKTAVVGWIE